QPTVSGTVSLGAFPESVTEAARVLAARAADFQAIFQEVGKTTADLYALVVEVIDDVLLGIKEAIQVLLDATVSGLRSLT
ncbi:hypothetical protein R0K19_27635, partial [Bacillus sp. SIMBA_161]